MANVSNMQVELGGLFEQNSTYDYTDYEYKEECVESISSGMSIFIPIIYSVAMVVGLLGNGLVLAVLWQKRRSWSVMDVFVLHLSLADVLLLLTLPLWKGQAVKGWIFGVLPCKLSGALFQINFYCSIFLLVCFSLDRYLSIAHDVRIFSGKKPWLIQLSCMLVWIFSLLLSIPDWIYLQPSGNPRMECVHSYPSPGWRLGSRLLYHVVGFLLPVTVLLICYSFILLRLQRGPQDLHNQRTMRVILALAVVFFLSWTPYNITLLVDTIQAASNNSTGLSGECKHSRWTAVKSTAVLGFLHCSFNPFIYFILSNKFQQWVLTVLRCGGCSLDCGDISFWESGQMDQHACGSPEEKGSLQPMNDLGQTVEIQKVSTDEKL